MPETSHGASSFTDPIDQLPLRLLRSEIVPPAPTRSQSSVDWLLDFAGYSWLAYGASTLLVISHLPSPLRGEDSTNGPIFRQIIEVSGEFSSSVTAVSWSPVTPSVGELAIGSGNYIYLFACDRSGDNGSFCWSQNAILVQATKVEAIEWTGSGDGIIAGGTEIVLWKRRNQSWEIAWKFPGDHLQDLVSSTWSFEGPFATATSWSKFPSECDEVGKRVLAYYSDGESYREVELPHPQGISMIQWRPVASDRSLTCIGKSMRNVLMTCCLDGAVRLWSEVDGGKTKKGMKDVNDHKKSFCVAAVIEINQVLDGYLGRDLFLFWGTRTGGILKTVEGTNQLFSIEMYDHENVGNCEWLVGHGPGNSASLWAVHCLDDISPMRFPRITLWARQKSNEIGAEPLSLADATGFSGRLPLNKVSVSRNNLYGIPLICSSIYLSPHNTVYWSSLHTIKSHDSEDSSANRSTVLKCTTEKILDLDGHGGKILQVAFDPIIPEAGYTASLDCNGLIIIWSSCDYLNRGIDHSISFSSWKPCGRLQCKELRLKYTCICWAPSSLNDERFLLVGHVEGVDCFSVRNCERGYDGFLTHYICTIPFSVSRPMKNGPTSIFARPLSDSCGKTFKSNRFLLLGVWMKEKRFDAQSLRVTLHHFDAAGSTCDCHFHDFESIESGKWLFEDTFAGKTNCIAVRSCSSEIPESHRCDEVTSFAVVNPSGRALPNDMNIEGQAYTMATGQADGSLKLWRSSLQESSTPVPWELVGMLTIGQNPVSAISLTDSGHKIAALCTANHSKAVRTISIWEIVHIIDSGVFMLEDKLHVDAEVVAVRWSAVGNDQLLLGVCTQKEMRVYGIARQPCRCTSFAVSDYSSDAKIWQCFAVTRTFSAIHDLWWGSKAMTALVHNDYVSLHGPWLAIIDKKQKIDNNIEIFAANLPNIVNATEEGRDSELLSDGISDLEEADTASISRGCISLPPTRNAIDDWQSNSMPLAGTEYGSHTIKDITSMLHMVEKLGGALPLYHPQALLVAIRSGNWKRASAALRHLAEYIMSNDASEKDYTVKSDPCPDILLSKYYEGSLSNDPKLKGFQWGETSGSMLQSSQFQTGLQSNFNMDSYSPSSSSSSPETDLDFSGFCEQLNKLSDGGNISRIEKMQYFAIVDLLCEISNPHSTSVYASLDEAGRRFWVTLRFKQLYLARSFGKTASMEELDIDSSMIGWAFHSESQENLSSSLLPNESSWQQMRLLGFGFWYSNVAQLRSRMEKLARQQYLKNKNPKDCALLYIALNRIQVLAGLFKISKDEKDKPLVGFLSRNFQEEKNKAAALKNAYVLMGKHQLELAIGFFLLGGEASSAINVCVKNLQDEQLALVICRLVYGQGGALESNLIKKYILPSAVQRGDFWLASLLEWELGEYHQSFLAMAGGLENPVTGSSTVTSNHISFVDPSIGLYCVMLTTRHGMKNALGESNASKLSRWATVMASTAFSRCGLPLEALECLSASASGHGGTHQANGPSNGHLHNTHGVLELSVADSSNWVSSGVSSTVDTQFRLGLAVQFLSKILREASALVMNSQIVSCEELSGFQHKLQTALEQFYQRFLLSSSFLRNMMILSAYNRGLLSMVYNIFQENSSSGLSVNKSYTDEDLLQYSALCKLILEATKEKSFVLSRIISACSVTRLHSMSCFEESKVLSGPEPKWSNALQFYFQRFLQSFSSLKTSIRLFLGSSVENLKTRLAVVLDLVEYCSRLAMAWILGDVNCLFRMVQPLTIAYFHGHMPYEVDLESLKRVYHQEVSVSVPVASDVGVNSVVEDNEVGYPVPSIPEDERRLVTQACFWKHVSDFVKHKLVSISIDLDDGISNSASCENFDAQTSLDSSTGIVCVTEKIMSVLGKTLISTLAQLSSYHVKQLVLLLKQKIEKRIQVPTLLWLHECRESQANLINRAKPDTCIENEDNSDLAVSVRFWKLCVDPQLVFEALLLENVDISEWSKFKPLEDWSNMYREVTGKNELNVPCNQDGRNSNESLASQASNLAQKAAITANENSAFQNPKEIHKRTGELIEALCINAINHRQAALASNRKGIIFFNLEDCGSCDDHSDYIWSDADWPHNGWANSESTPVPTCVSLGVGLGDKKGAHLGLGGATVGVVSLSKPGKAHSVPGYTGLGASGLGWETQEDFEQFVDPPPTVETVVTRAFSSHPTMPLFLVGSSNTHIYLWEFGKDRATATYGVLPAANVPPPYALASISAVQFGPCGHRFASAALDGTVCTWQSEVGGRSNIHPVESSLCFNGHASDVEYISSSGSIVAASGHSSSGVNVVVWDTLAPPSTSQASISCHEGGARSISVFDNDIGSGSISPMIVTGGKNGDVGLHDFRYIATGKMKKQRNSDGRSWADGDQNKNGMLWYIPKAHLGSVTKISTIPRTSLFLTGSKDGDVKLWDAKAAKLIHHWPKLHERHTFLQPNSRGYGGIIRAGVTDIQVCPSGFMTCGGDGTVKFVSLRDSYDQYGK